MKKISIIIPVYNVEGYLETMAKSLLSQNWENLQVIFSDDGSTDGSLAILRRLAENDPRITVVTGANGGVSSARNRALRLADGDYIGFCDADDSLAPDYLSTLVSLLEEHGADCAVCGFDRIYEASGKADRMPPKDAEDAVVDREGFFEKMLRPDGYTTVVWNKLFRREVLLDETGEFLRFAEDLHIVEDGEYLFRCGVEKAVFTTRRLYRYTVRKSGAMYGRLNPRKLTEIEARKRIAALASPCSKGVSDLAKMKYQKGVRDLLFHAVIDGQYGDVKHLIPLMKEYKAELFTSHAVSKKEKLKYRIYPIIIRLNLRRTGKFLMDKLSGH